MLMSVVMRAPEGSGDEVTARSEARGQVSVAEVI